MVALDRRGWLQSSATVAALWNDRDNVASPQRGDVSLDEAVRTICHGCPLEFRRAVRDSGGHLLYRGEQGVDRPAVLNPAPDLLLPSTYKNDPKALEYFTCLEKDLVQGEVQARPSTGHIGTANKADAEPWGSPVSVWPLGDTISYVWPKSRNLLYPGTCPDRDLVSDEGLEDALSLGKEVLFATFSNSESSIGIQRNSSFLVVPSSYDERLVAALSKEQIQGVMDNG